MKKLMTLAFMALALTANAQEKKTTTIEVPQWVKNIKFSGYGMLQYQADDKYKTTGIDDQGNYVDKKDAENSFNLRLLRLILDGKIGDWAWRAQVQGTSSAGPGNATCNLVDLFAEWQKYDEVRVKVGQFKRAFSFENPTHPITQGWYTYAMVINNLVGFGDRTGEKSSGGRDIGIQLQGDVLKTASGRPLLHYQVGVYNGEGINAKDKDNRKDIIGGLWVMPVKGLRVGAFGWTGSRGKMDITQKIGGQTVTVNHRSVEKNRYALSAEWDKDDWTFRTEYVHSQGLGSDMLMGTKADGWYVFGIAPVVAKKLYAKARYQTYRKTAKWSSAKTMYEVGANYMFTPRLQLNVEYARVNDRNIINPDKHNYNFADVQLDFRF